MVKRLEIVVQFGDMELVAECHGCWRVDEELLARDGTEWTQHAIASVSVAVLDGGRGFPID
jgi:hypothetical protein